MILLVVDSPDLLVAGVRDLIGVLGQLDLRDQASIRSLDRRQLVDTAEGRGVLRCDQVCPDAPGIDAGPLGLQRLDHVLIQIGRSGNGGVRKSCVIKHLSCLFGQVRQVAGVQTDAVLLRLPALCLHLGKHPDGVRHTGAQRVVGVDQQHTIVRVVLGVLFKSRVLVREAHDPAVGMGPEHRYIEELSGQDIGRADAAADHSRPCTIRAGIRPLCTPQAEFHDAVPLRRVADAGGLGGNQALVVDDVQNRGLHELCFHDRRDHLDQRLPREDHRSFRDGIDIA